MTKPTILILDQGMGALLAVGYVAVLMATAGELALSRDESFYVVAAEQIAHWFEAVAAEPSKLFDRELIDRYWEYNHEHPGLMKAWFALGWLLEQHTQLFGSDSLAFRFFGMVTGGLLLWVTYLFGTRVHSRTAGLFGALALALMPRVFYHSHLNCFDVPIVFWLTLVTFLYWKSLREPKWAIAVGISFGLALATKHNAWVLPGVLLIHWLWVRTAQERAGFRQGWRRWIPWWLVAMATLGIPVFVMSWPWLWHDGWNRFVWYANFHTNHVHYPVEYFGHTYSVPPFPISLPWVLTAFTVPATTLWLFGVGLVCSLPRWLPDWAFGRALRRALGSRRGDRYATDVLWLGCLLAPLVVISLPHTPIFGGTKHWMPAYPFLALFAGVGFGNTAAWLAERLSARVQATLVPLGTPLLGGLLLTPALLETVHSHPFALSHYTMLAGHVPGAASLGMNRQFWGFTQGSLAAWLRQKLPKGGSVWPCDATHYAWHMMVRDGMLPSNIRAAASMSQADYILVHHEQHFLEVEAQAWVVTGRVAPEHVLLYDGVPLVSVYKNPHRGARSVR